jgi:hypothetical protein
MTNEQLFNLFYFLGVDAKLSLDKKKTKLFLHQVKKNGLNLPCIFYL